MGSELTPEQSAAFERYVLTQGPGLVRLARGLLKDAHRAEDVVQDVLARAVLSWSRIERADDPHAYVRRMVVNACTSYWRRVWVRREASTEPGSLPESPTDDHGTAIAARAELLGLLARLPARQRAVLVLRHYEALPDDEIATLLGCSQNTVRSNAFRGLAALRRMLGEGATGESG